MTSDVAEKTSPLTTVISDSIHSCVSHFAPNFIWNQINFFRDAIFIRKRDGNSLRNWKSKMAFGKGKVCDGERLRRESGESTVVATWKTTVRSANFKLRSASTSRPNSSDWRGQGRGCVGTATWSLSWDKKNYEGKNCSLPMLST